MTAASEPMGCAEAVSRLWDLVDGDIAATDQLALDRHLAWCVRCCGELAFAREMRSMLRDRTDVGLPVDVQVRLEGFIDALDRPADEAGPR